MSVKSGQKPTVTLSLDAFTMFASQIVDYGANVAGKSSKLVIPSVFKNPFKNFKFEFKNIKAFVTKRNIIILSAAIIVVIVGVVVLKLVTGTRPLVISSTTSNFNPQDQINVNRQFNIPIRNAKGAETGDKLAITLTNVDRSKRILIQGKPATARDTKVFVILNLEIENSTRDQLTIRPVDLIRLIDSQSRSFAPDVHNNEVTAEPVSIKKTRVGFVVDEGQKNFKFLVGEIAGNKESVEVTI